MKQQQQQHEARVSREASKTVQVHMGGQWKRSSATTIVCHKKASLNNSNEEIKYISGEAIEMAQVQVESH